ncbi:TetR/AcrR family transcriptional regulator [Streptomyces xanthochromogenes]|uniref:TetR/AcrR family transcriptional regulator n=1 Tax=Streptomyces xanthochromogenes TaxID=67384 RepID=UPI003810CB46
MARAGLTVERLAAAGAELADEAGFDGITVSELARRFGVKDASLYSHVKNLRELRQRVTLYAAGEFIDSIAAAVAGRAGQEALVAFADAYRAYALAHPGRYAATQHQVDPELLAGTTVLARTVDTTYGMLRAYGLTEPDLTDAVRLLRSTFHGYIALEAEGGFGHPREVQRSWDRGVQALHVLLEHWPRSEEGEKDDD